MKAGRYRKNHSGDYQSPPINKVAVNNRRYNLSLFLRSVVGAPPALRICRAAINQIPTTKYQKPIFVDISAGVCYNSCIADIAQTTDPKRR